MRDVACHFCRIHGRDLNPFRQAKVTEHGCTLFHRIQLSFRLLGEFLPTFPFGRLSDHDWEWIRAAISIRNRITHPATLADLEVSPQDVNRISVTARFFMDRFKAFFHGLMEEQQKALWAAGAPRVRVVRKIGRNEPCVCQSGRKYKACCGRED
jgi:hypothetical protein